MTILLVFGIMAGCFLLMAAGLWFKGRKTTLKGSCGGLSSGEMGPDVSCPTCEGDASKCSEAQEPGGRSKPGVVSKS